jgi:phospholipid-binding lipoprotein MlaA
MSARPAASPDRLFAGAVVLALLGGCATLPPGTQPSPKDPYERFNRSVFAFNDTLDEHAVKPVAKAYVAVVPSPVRTGVSNFFGNFSDAWSAVNQLLQGKPEQTARMGMRFVINTTVGIGGIFDPATKMGLERQSEDLGQTFGRWGVGPGPYLVLPLFGPSDVRDAVALPADRYVSPALLVDTTGAKLAVDALDLVQTRAEYLQASNMLNDIALDRYQFLRDAYIARRRSLVYDGNPPDEPSTEDATEDSHTNARDVTPGAAAASAAQATAPAAPASAASAPAR